jgi:hypothetical protein
MAKFHITMYRHVDNKYPYCFREMMRLIQWGLQEMGHDCTRSENSVHKDRTNIIFGFHEWWWPLKNPLEVIRDYDCIIYQAEQLSPGGRQMPDWYHGAMRHAKAVWEYSPDNLAILHRNGIPAVHVPPAWTPKYKAIDDIDTVQKDIDAVFMGAVNPRRQFALQLMGALVDEVHVLQSVWGDERDEYMARSKMMVNIHFYQSQTLELLRISHALNSAIPVVSEYSPSNPWEDAIKMVAYEHLGRAVVELSYSQEQRKKLGRRGQDAFRSVRIEDILEKALDSDGSIPSSELDPSSPQHAPAAS